MTLRLGGDGAITGCTSLENPDLTVSGLTISGSFDAEKVLVTSGTAAAPSYTFSGDVDTGMYAPAGANQLALVTGGNDAIYIDDNQNVGFGTDDPRQHLHAKSASLNVRLEVESTAGNGSPAVRLTNDAQTYDLELEGGSDRFRIYDATADSERLTIDTSGRLLMGSTVAGDADADNVNIAGAGNVGITIRGDNIGTGNIFFADGTTGDDLKRGQIRYDHSNNSMRFHINAVERVRIDSSGRLLVGTSNPLSGFFGTPNAQALNGTPGSFAIGFYNSNQYGPRIDFVKSRSTTINGQTVVQDNDILGEFYFGGSDGTGPIPAARIVAEVDGTPGTNDMPGRLVFATTADSGTSPAERMRIDSSGKVGIGTTSPSQLLDLASTAPNLRFTDTVDGHSEIDGNAANLKLNADKGNTKADSNISFAVDNSEAMRIDSSGRLLINMSSSKGDGSPLQITNDTANPIEVFRGQNSTSGPTLLLNKSRGTTASPAVVQNGDHLGGIAFKGYSANDSAYKTAALIRAMCDGDPDSGSDPSDMPGRIDFATAADGSASPVRRLRIDSVGRSLFGTSNVTPAANNVAGAVISADSYLSISRSGDLAIEVNRMTNDGKLMRFLQAGTEEGNISVNGTTVSYNGGHLSRWSQLASGAERIEILRGSVLSNLNEMCEWGSEDNEQLNRMKVSDIEGDPNVAGVFQAWDDDDEIYTNDFYCAMTGDFVIRIAQGTTVARGDLLMSAGDGTAKPQSDDIVRSKTVAKVTSTVVSETYSDGSYCVPCVLMAC